MKAKNNFYGKAKAAMLMAIVMVCTSQITLAQDRWSFEFRPNVNFSTEKLGDVNLNTSYNCLVRQSSINMV